MSSHPTKFSLGLDFPIREDYNTCGKKNFFVSGRNRMSVFTNDEQRVAWISEQRRAYSKRILDLDKINKLESLSGWSWGCPCCYGDLVSDVLSGIYGDYCEDSRKKTSRKEKKKNQPSVENVGFAEVMGLIFRKVKKAIGYFEGVKK